MGDPLNNPLAQLAVYHDRPTSLLSMDNSGQPPPSLVPAITPMPEGVQDPNQVKLWKAIGDQYRRFLKNLARMQPAQRNVAANHAMGPASGPQTRSNPTQDNLAVQQLQPGAGSLQHPGLANASSGQHSPLLAPTTASLPVVEDPSTAKLWKAIGDQYRNADRKPRKRNYAQDSASATSSQARVQSDPGPSWTPQLPSQRPAPNASSAALPYAPFPQLDVKQQTQQATFRQSGQQNMAIPRGRDAFLRLIQQWFLQTELNADAIPKIGDKPLDLYQLYIEVDTLGGMDKVQAFGLWRLVAARMGYTVHEQNDSQLAQVAKILANTYVTLLVPFNSFCMDEMRALHNASRNNRLDPVGHTQRIGVGPDQGVPPGVMSEDGGAGVLPAANFQRMLAFLHATLKDWLPEVSPQTKLLRAAEMDVPAMQREGWPADRIQIVGRFRPILIQYRNVLTRQQELQRQASGQQGMRQQNAQMRVQTVETQQSTRQQQHVGDQQSSSGGEPLPPDMQTYNLHGTGALKVPFSPEASKEAQAIVNSMFSEIEQTRQYNRREVPKTQRMKMNHAVVAALPFAVEFERTASLHYLLFNEQPKTRAFMEQAALLREQYRILQSGQQEYIMTSEELTAVRLSLQTVSHDLRVKYSQTVKQHQEEMNNLRAAELHPMDSRQSHSISRPPAPVPWLSVSPASSISPGNHTQKGSPEAPPQQGTQHSAGKDSVVRGTKRHLEAEHDQNTEDQGATPKRGKIIQRDYADASPSRMDSPLRQEDANAADGTTQDMGTDDSAHGAQSTVDTRPGQISCEEIFQRLVDHGCVDLSSQMDPEQYSSGLIIGGAFGDIWKGKLRDGTEVAIKVWRFSSLLHNGWKTIKRAMREIYYWSKAKHEYVQELMGVIMFHGRLGMVSRWMEHGNLREYICKNPSADRYMLCMQVATGIAYLHSREMIHGDLKGANILVSRNGVAKLSDFDHSIMTDCSLAFSETSKMGGGTTRWMAPELMVDESCNRNAHTDVYALGMTMLEIITGTSPYYPQYKTDMSVMWAIAKKTLPSRPMDHFSDSLRDNRMWELLLSCWSYDPLARPKAAEVVESLQTICTLPSADASKALVALKVERGRSELVEVGSRKTVVWVLSLTFSWIVFERILINYVL